MSAAVDVVAAGDSGRWRSLTDANKSVTNVNRWIGKRGLGRKRGVPDWNNWGALVKGHGGGKETTVTQEFARRFFELYLHPNCPGVKQTWRKVCRVMRSLGMGDQCPSYEAMNLYRKKNVSAHVESKYRGGSQKHRETVVGYLKRWCNVQVGAAVFSDHRIMDFWVKTKNENDEWVAVRPWMTAMMDARSMFITAAIIYVQEYPNHTRIMEALEMHLRRTGNRIPQYAYTDNGKDFLKRGMATATKLKTKRGGHVLTDASDEQYEYSVLSALGIEHKLAGAYNGREKPIERVFRDTAMDWERTQTGYCGNRPSNRPNQAETWEGDVDRLPTIGQAVADFNRWLEEEGQQHMREDGKTRAQMWEEADLSYLPQLEDKELFLRILLPQQTAVKVSRTPMGPGVKFAGWTYSHRDLREYWGQPMMIKTYWGTPKVRVQKPTRGRGLVWDEVPMYVFAYTPDDVFVAACPADGMHAEFGGSEEERIRRGQFKHMINAIEAGTTDEFEQLTGRRQIMDPQRALEPIQAQPTTGIVELPALPERSTRRLQGAGRPQAEPVHPADAGSWDDVDEDYQREVPELERLLREQQEQQDEW
jgi:hypothetical protein